MKFKSSSSDTVQGNYLLHITNGHNSVRLHKGFKCCFACQYPWKPIPTQNFYQNWKLYPFLKHILSVFRFTWLLGCDLTVDEQTIFFQVIHVDKMIISYKKEGVIFRVDALCDRGYNYVFFS